MLELDFREQIGDIQFWFILEDGENIGFISLQDFGDRINIVNIAGPPDKIQRMVPFGSQRIREILRLLKQEFPEAATISGQRITGVRVDRPPEEQRVTRRI